MAPRKQKKAKAVKKLNGFRRCIVEASVLSTKQEHSRSFGPGMVIDGDDYERLLKDKSVLKEWFELERTNPGVNDGIKARP